LILVGDKPRSLDFLENLESIEGQRLYFDKFSLYVAGNYHLTSLGLKSLRKILSGVTSFRQNRNLCYGRGIPFKEKYRISSMVWADNMPDRECGQFCFLWSLCVFQFLQIVSEEFVIVPVFRQWDVGDPGSLNVCCVKTLKKTESVH
jgi:hypothetical protein